MNSGMENVKIIQEYGFFECDSQRWKIESKLRRREQIEGHKLFEAAGKGSLAMPLISKLFQITVKNPINSSNPLSGRNMWKLIWQKLNLSFSPVRTGTH